jgi:serine/threonine-protein kinase
VRALLDTLVDGRYLVQRRIGSGGMAEVYCAEDQQLGRKVALKVLHARFAEDPDFVERFRREASAAAGLSHPNIVQVYDRGEWDGTYYIAMEYLDGRSLKQLVREDGPLDPARAVDITIGVLKAARSAHRRGVVHRDIKPHNVIVDDERPRVTDFGIARAGASDMTETGSILGTAQYLSPEQAQGLAVDERSDLYSIGVLLYELLTGRVPFDAESAVTIALRHVSEPPPPPSAARPGLPPALDAIVLRALAKDPADRFQNADEFLRALERLRGHAAIPAGPAPAPSPVPAGPPTGARVTGAHPLAYPDEPLPEDDEERGRRWPWLVLAALILAGLAVAAYLALRPELRPVPDVVGRQGDTAAQILQNAGFEVDIETVESETVPRNRVSTQRPQPGVDAELGTTVTITVSDGPGQRALPDVVGLRRVVAQRRLRAAGFRVAVEQRYADDVPRGRVIETRPQPGTVVERGTRVAVIVSRGVEQVVAPDVTALDRAAAETALREAGLGVTVTEEETDAEAPGQVLRQDPAGGVRVDRGATVTVVVATAPPEEEAPPAEPPVPDVVDLSADDAAAALSAAGYVVARVTEPVDSPEEDGLVLAQDPGGGEVRPAGTRVTITVGVFDPGENLDPDGDEGPEVPADPTPEPGG